MRAIRTGLGVVWCVAVSPDGKRVAAAGSDDGWGVEVWDIESNEQAGITGPESRMRSASPSIR
ncbi:MAG: WD40 repeat domain-containing protein [Gemmataceae bacterium]|nr:WD40 repeat domain-containing protein [Gemmataceae bacterium]